ncbi:MULTISPECIES: cation diffusion facilitator family transporter [unclassified Streptococcus]|uniref:cation diffusion facilitator family transporter n=1 Tax=unclassified Streptococcus TaxID=2608887 RepID=UPI001071690F|nr:MULTISPECIES: cation diffusion facilitator family transporter [unclassified Streptococcus]MBF0806046.1 cation diffusion facilitator family transporter [Streptococcus sp. 19428wA2_WM07]TFU28391.1 cation diffusion facilitator family transporter [Streptococcus sp. WM07]
MSSPTQNLKMAERGALLAIATYILLSIFKIITGHLFGSASITADGLNNMTDILGNVAVLIGLRLAQKPADRDHKFGHWKMEDLASLITSLIMLLVGFQVLFQSMEDLLQGKQESFDPQAIWVGLFSALVMTGVYLYNRNLAKRVHSKALEAAAMDNLSDVLTSLGTSLAILASQFQFYLIDKIIAIIISLIILKTAYDIFREATFSLSDGFDENLLEQYSQSILTVPKIDQVKEIRGRSYGSHIYLDLILAMNPDLSVYESHTIADQVEHLLQDQYGVFDIDIHIEPSPIPEDEDMDFLLKKLFLYQSQVEAGQNLDDYIAEDFTYIPMNGQVQDRTAYLVAKHQEMAFKKFQVKSISQKTKLVSYQLNGKQHTTIWRRHEDWQQIFHQETQIGKEGDKLG